jgi:hypothetical protein
MTNGMIDPALNQREMTIAAILIGAALLLAVMALVVAIRSQARAFWRTVPTTTPEPLRRLGEPDVCDPAWRELEADPSGPDGDDGDEEDDDESLAARGATVGGNSDMLIEIGFAIFTRDEVEKLAAIRERWMAGAA